MPDDYGYESGSSDLGADYEKDPDDTTDYTFVWARLDGDTILTTEFLLPDGLTSVSQSTSGIEAVIFVTGGSIGSIYRITSRMTSAGGRRWDHTIRVAVREL